MERSAQTHIPFIEKEDGINLRMPTESGIGFKLKQETIQETIQEHEIDCINSKKKLKSKKKKEKRLFTYPFRFRRKKREEKSRGG